MRDIQEVVIDDLIVHITEPKRDLVVISDACVPLVGQDQVAGYFAEHIVRSLQDAGAKAASFPGDGSSWTRDLCAEMLTGSRETFVRGSQKLATHLAEILAKLPQTSDGDLAICRYRQKNTRKAKAGAAGEPYLAIIKLDPVGAFRNVTETDPATGALYVNLEVDPYVFPRSADVLQKGAYVRNPQVYKKFFQMLMVDKQTKTRGAVAKFFGEEFMGAVYVNDPAELTLRLYRSLVRSLNELRPTLTWQEDQYLGQEIYQIFAGVGSFNVTTWLNGLTVSPTLKATLRSEVSRVMQNQLIVQRDPALAEELTRRRVFSGQGLLHFSILSASYDAVVKSVDYIAGPAAGYYRIVLETTSWTEQS